ncbi:hypothetical protein PHMEG_00020483 [Phytophthora megakarya]|uniref:Jacalin-type lectin domain-containing protein n=1 Tax=Phytophthora megakarya TaxID=4795 RepID=A0A225VNN6_9STRA|nr:hypothetical protein PHMEG_00020483 [Phytophthora megakarya]
MKFIYQVLAAVVLMATNGITALEKGVLLGETFGGPHGDKYSDLDLVDPGQTVQSITIRSADRVDGVSLAITNMVGQKSTLEHGGNGGDKETLYLDDGEYITGIEVHWGKYYRKTRIMYIQFTTNKDHTISGGTPQDNTDKIGKESAENGYQLGGFIGFAGNELDSVGAIWTSIQPVE